jgi:hypothetical protein
MQHRPGPGLTPEPPLTRLARRLSASETRASEYRSVCASHYPAPSSKLQAPGSTALVGFSHRHVPEHSNRIRPGYEFTFRRVAHYCRLTDDPWADPALPELSGSPEVPSTRVAVASIGCQATVILANPSGSGPLRFLCPGIATLASSPFRFLLRGALAGLACPPKRI